MAFRTLCASLALALALWSAAAQAQVVRQSDPLADWSAIRHILQDKSISPEWRDERGNSAAFYQLFYGSEQRAADLIARASRKGRWIEGNGDSLLEAAIYAGSPRVVQALIRHGEPVDRFREGHSAPLQLAARMGQYDTVRLLLRAGADGYCTGCVGDPPVAEALRHGDWQLVLLMRDLGVDIERYRRQPRQGELVFRAIDAHSADALVMLEQLGFDLAGVDNEAGMSPVAYMLSQGYVTGGSSNFVLDQGDYCRRNARGERILEQITGIKWLSEPGNDYFIELIRTRTAPCSN